MAKSKRLPPSQKQHAQKKRLPASQRPKDPDLVTKEVVAGLVATRDEAERVVAGLRGDPQLRSIEYFGAEPNFQFRVKAIMLNQWTEHFVKGIVAGAVRLVEENV